MAQMSPLNIPLTFTPRYKSVIWGGNLIPRLKDDRACDPKARIGESWEISAIPGHESVVDAGVLCGSTLGELCRRYGAELLGKRVMERYGCRFPLLVKLIDAHNDLSIQVHPNDEAAARLSGPGAHGKSEMWYVISARKGARIYSGLCAGTDPETFMRHVAEKTLLQMVCAHHSAPGQFYFIPAGTVHSIGTGNLIAEIQEASDITYRLYDFDRRDACGQLRPLHIEQARECIDFSSSAQLNTPTAQVCAASEDRVVSCPSFTADYIDLQADAELYVENSGDSFHILMAVGGELTITLPDGARWRLGVGHTALMPAAVSRYTLTGPAKALKVYV